jgi:hypothetical protein
MKIQLYSLYNLVVKHHAPTALPPGKRTDLNGSQGQSGQVLRISPPLEFNPRSVQNVVSRYTDYAIPVHISFLLLGVRNTWRNFIYVSNNVISDKSENKLNFPLIKLTVRATQFKKYFFLPRNRDSSIWQN